MDKILNPWASNNVEPAYYEEDIVVYENGPYKIYSQRFASAHLYVYEDVAFNCLVGLNKEHLDNVANRTRPKSNPFLYDRALENLQRAQELRRIYNLRTKQ